jgi:integrase
MSGDLRNKATWKRSLRTKDPKEAKKRTAALLAACMADFEHAERAQRGELSPKPHRTIDASGMTLEEIETDFLASLLAGDEEFRRDGDQRQHHQSPEERQQWPDLTKVRFGRKGMPEDQEVAYGNVLEEDAAAYRRALSRQNIEIVEPELGAFLRKKGQPVEPDSDFYYETGLAILRAHVRAYDAMLARQGGAIVETPKPSSGKGPKLSDAFDGWKSGGGARGAKKPSPRTITEAEYAVRRFKEWHGDLRLGDITKEKARTFRDALGRVPIRLSKKEQQKPLPALLKGVLDSAQTSAATTVNKSLQMLSAILGYSEREGELDHLPTFKNPFKGIKLVVDRRQEDNRTPFTQADLTAIFATGIFTKGERPRGGGDEAAFWLPVLGLLTGARLGELAQLRIGDVKQDRESGLWFIDIGTAGGRTIKTATSRRKVPLHPHLIEMGFLRYHQFLLERGGRLEADLWPGIKSDIASQKAAAWSKWFGRFLRKVAKVEDGNKVFHSFRHSFKDMSREATDDLELRNALTGHSTEGVGSTYGEGFRLKALGAVVEKIEVPEAVKRLSWSPNRKPLGGP